MRTSNILILGILCFAISINTQQATADPTPIGVGADPPPPEDCDNYCRLRQYVYNYDPEKRTRYYYKYETATCQICTEGLCLPTKDEKEIDTTAQCYVKKGQEGKNKTWLIQSKTVCDFPKSVYLVEAEPRDPKDLDQSWPEDITYCRSKDKGVNEKDNNN